MCLVFLTMVMNLIWGLLQREKEHKEIDFDSARKRLQQNYRQAENGLFLVSYFYSTGLFDDSFVLV